MMDLNYSLNLQEFFGHLFPLITFDILPSDRLYEYVFGLSEIDDSPISEEFDLVGYESRLIYGNLGSLGLFFLLIWIKQILILILPKVIPKRLMHRKVRSFLK